MRYRVVVTKVRTGRWGWNVYVQGRRFFWQKWKTKYWSTELSGPHVYLVNELQRKYNISDSRKFIRYSIGGKLVLFEKLTF
jgi:hypothetical protein